MPSNENVEDSEEAGEGLDDGTMAHEVYDQKHGKYEGLNIPAPSATFGNPLDPTPFTIKGN